MSRPRSVILLLAVGVPATALAQELNATIVWLFVGAPLLAIVATIVASLVQRSWRVMLVGLGSIVFWITWYWVAAQYAQEDVLFWVPIVAIHVQVAAIAGWLGWRVFRRMRE